MRRFLVPLALLAGLLPATVQAGVYSDLVLAGGPTAYYQFNGDVTDSVGSADGTTTALSYVIGSTGPSFDAGNMAGDFENALNDEVLFGSGIRDGLSGASFVSAEILFDPRNSTSFDPLFTVRGDTNSAAFNFNFSQNGTSPVIRFGGRSAGTSGYQNGGNVSVTGLDGFIYAVGVMDLANDQILTYVNGVLERTQSVSFVGTTFGSGATSDDAIGGVAGNANFTYDGLIDELAFYNRELTPSEISARYAAITAIPEPTSVGLVGIAGTLVVLRRRRR